jgi:hypothetical protein
MVEVLTVDAASTIQLLEAIEALFSMLAPVHVFLDNARYHHPPPPDLIQGSTAAAAWPRIVKISPETHSLFSASPRFV